MHGGEHNAHLSSIKQTSCHCQVRLREEGENASLNDALNTFYLRLYGRKEGRKYMFYLSTHSTHSWLYGVIQKIMVKEHSDSERGNPLPPLHGLLFPINSKDNTYHGLCDTSRGALAGTWKVLLPEGRKEGQCSTGPP